MRTTLTAAVAAVSLLAAACGGSDTPAETAETVSQSTTSSAVAVKVAEPSAQDTAATVSETVPSQDTTTTAVGQVTTEVDTGAQGTTTVPTATSPETTVTITPTTSPETAVTTTPTTAVTEHGDLPTGVNVLSGLRVAVEDCSGYTRDHYRTHGSSWKQLGGVGYLTGQTLSSGDVDHVVSLHEAWCSGIRDPKFGSDKSNHRASVSSVNRGKGQHDPREWWNTSGKTTPRTSNYPGWCDYLVLHVEVKNVWGGTVDQAEHDFLVKHLSDCGHSVTGTGQAVDVTKVITTTEPVTATTVKVAATEPVTTTTEAVTTTTAQVTTTTKPVPTTTKPSGECTHNGRGHSFLGRNPGTHTHPTSDHSHDSGKCAGV